MHFNGLKWVIVFVLDFEWFSFLSTYQRVVLKCLNTFKSMSSNQMHIGLMLAL